MANIQQTNRLTLIKQTVFGTDSKGIFKCSCGKEKELRINTVRMNKTRSCGCLQDEQRLKRTEDAVTKSPLYTIWIAMKSRCYNKNSIKNYSDYGGRGVVVCKEWVNNFDAFKEWALKNGWRKGLQIDKDIKAKEMGFDGLIYSPEMCQFVTSKVNNNSRRTSRFITFNNQTKTISEWSEITGIPSFTISARLNKLKWSIEKSLTNKKNSS